MIKSQNPESKAEKGKEQDYLKTLQEIKEQSQEEDYANFLQNLHSISSQEELIKELSSFLNKKNANTYGKRLFQQGKDKNIFCPQSQGKTIKQPSVLAEIQKKIGDAKQFKDFKNKMNNLVEELIDYLSKYTGTIQAEALAKRLFIELGKDKIITNQIQHIHRDLKLKKVDDPIIANIMNLIEKGKKKAVQRILVEFLGIDGGKQMFNKYQKHIQEKIDVPNSESIFRYIKEGLKIYQYKQTLREEQKLSAKTIIVFGETGCGKSTFLNATVNYLAEVEMQDPYRYKIIIENQQNQLSSITSSITSYFIKNPRTNFVYRLIDTPGFGDTSGYTKDTQIVELVKQKFQKQIDQVHCVLFIMKASKTRVMAYQTYVFQSIMDLFSKDIAPNFVFIFTFSDSGKPQVLPAVQDEENGFGNYWNLIQQPKYLEVNSCGIFQKINVDDQVKVGYWKIGMVCMQKLFQKINIIAPKSLQLSKELMKKKQSLANQMRVNHIKIQEAITNRQNLIKQMKIVMECQQQMDNNKKNAQKQKAIYDRQNNKLKKSQIKIIQLITDMQNQMKIIIDQTKIMINLQEDLVKNQMSTKKPESTISYMNYLILNEKKAQTAGYEIRIQNMQGVIKQMFFFESLKSNSPEEVTNKIKGHQREEIESLCKNAPPSLIETLKRYFSFD